MTDPEGNCFKGEWRNGNSFIRGIRISKDGIVSQIDNED